MNLVAAVSALERDGEVSFVARGNSMTPLIKNGERVTVRAARDNETFKRGDIVLAKVRGNIYLHKVTAVEGNRVQIGNNRGHVNGWTTRERVFGVLVSAG